MGSISARRRIWARLATESTSDCGGCPSALSQLAWPVLWGLRYSLSFHLHYAWVPGSGPMAFRGVIEKHGSQEPSSTDKQSGQEDGIRPFQMCIPDSLLSKMS